MLIGVIVEEFIVTVYDVIRVRDSVNQFCFKWLLQEHPTTFMRSVFIMELFDEL